MRQEQRDTAARPDESTPADQTAPGKQQRLKREPTTSLRGYFEQSRLRAPRFLKDMQEANKWTFSPEDLSYVLDLHGELDPHFTKTAGLLSEALKGKDRRYARPAAEFAREAVLKRLSDYPRWIGNSWENGTAAERAVAVATAVSRRLGDRKAAREAQNVLTTSLQLLAYEDGLEYEEAVRAVIRALELQSSIHPAKDQERVIYLAAPRPSLAELRRLIQLIVPWIRQAAEQEERAEAAESRATSERSAAEANAAAIERLEAEQETLRQELASAEGRIHDLEDELRSSLVHGSHDLERTRSALRAFLGGRLTGLLGTVSEALEVDPPRHEVAREKLDVARDAIQEQVKWLQE